MKRKLTTEERTLTEKGIRNMHKELSGYMEELKLLEASLEYLEFKRKYEDLVQPYNRRKQDKDMKANFSALRVKIDEVSKSIKIDQHSLKEGIEIKKPVGVQ